ncbi:unnamed protein product [Acanthoscelides obtectus]|nr:unnamed protein product [Acanthoscelides obtectus]CAK1669998.1 Neutral alpha-glucosidase AB [Acanthoscelides obtectus]
MPSTAQWTYIKHNVNGDNTLVTVKLEIQKKTYSLFIGLLENHKVRLQLKDTSRGAKKRHEIKDVLYPDIPKSIRITTEDDDGFLTIVPNDATMRNHSVLIHKSPLVLNFTYNDKTLVVLNSSSLNMSYDKTIRDIGFTVKFEDAQKLYGLHHHAYNLELPDTTLKTVNGSHWNEPFRLWNSDARDFEADSPMALYGSVPAIYGHSKKSTAGIFLHNAAEQWVDISYSHGSASARFMVDSGSFDLFVMLGPKPEDVVKQFTDLTGRAHMPQLWTLGYHQSRWSYYTKEEVLEVVKNMTQNDFPLDAIWLDIDYTDDKKYFTWSKNFTGEDGNGVRQMLKILGDDGRKLVAIVDPHIKVDENYGVYEEGKNKHFVKVKDGRTDFVGKCWPGNSSYVDFLNSAARTYYGNHYSDNSFNHGHPEVLAGIWNDMNEPSVDDDQHEWTMPSDNRHSSKGNRKFDVEHRDIHNMYGFLHTMATHEGLINRDKNGTRPFILTRSHFAGSQRFAAMWTGDNRADWPHLKNSYSECMLSNLMGHVFCGADVPGFFGDPDPEFSYRAYQAGIWLPFFRGHAHKDAKPREPYRYEPEVQEIIRNAIRMRYKYIPTWYTLFYEHTLTGAPVIRPLFYHYPGTVNRNDHIMLGRDILARPVFEPSNETKTIEVHLPGNPPDFWYRVDDKSSKIIIAGTTEIIPYVDANTSPVFYRAGSIVVLWDYDVSSTAETVRSPRITLYVNCKDDKNHTASGRLYHDDGFSFDYENKNKHLYVDITFTEETGLKFEEVPEDPDQDSEDMKIYVDKVIYNERNSGSTYKSTRHEIDVDGNLFSNIDIVQAIRNDKELVYKLTR